MSPLESLVRLHKRLEATGDVASPGWSSEKFGLCITIDEQGRYVDSRIMDNLDGNKSRPVIHRVPDLIEGGRTSGCVAHVFWDKLSYSLGLGSDDKRYERHSEFVRRNREILVGATDPCLVALDAFLGSWNPEGDDAKKIALLFTVKSGKIIEPNVLFELDGVGFVHDCDEAHDLVEKEKTRQEKLGEVGVCLITGETGYIARIHPSFKKLARGQSSGCSMATNNAPAWSFIGMEKGENASTGADASLRYGLALNSLLSSTNNRLRYPVGGMNVVYWADSDGEGARSAEALVSATFEGISNDKSEDARLDAALTALAKGKSASSQDLGLDPDATFNILGVAGNGGRLSVRFWQSGKVSGFLERMSDHARDVMVEPTPWRRIPSVDHLVMMACVPEDISRPKGRSVDWGKVREYLDSHANGVAEGITRAVLTGTLYPAAFLQSILRRMRAGDEPTGWHAAGIRAVLSRQQRLGSMGVEVPMALDESRNQPGYLAGRLFAMLEEAQRQANRNINATIRDRFFSSAMATPRAVMPSLLARSNSHLSKLRRNFGSKEIDVRIGTVYEQMSGTFPISLNAEQRGEFVLGYFHERSRFKALSSARFEAKHGKALNNTEVMTFEGEAEND